MIFVCFCFFLSLLINVVLAFLNRAYQLHLKVLSIHSLNMKYSLRSLLHSATDRFENRLERHDYTFGLIHKTTGF